MHLCTVQLHLTRKKTILEPSGGSISLLIMFGRSPCNINLKQGEEPELIMIHEGSDFVLKDGLARHHLEILLICSTICNPNPSEIERSDSNDHHLLTNLQTCIVWHLIISADQSQINLNMQSWPYCHHHLASTCVRSDMMLRIHRHRHHPANPTKPYQNIGPNLRGSSQT